MDPYKVALVVLAFLGLVGFFALSPKMPWEGRSTGTGTGACDYYFGQTELPLTADQPNSVYCQNEDVLSPSSAATITITAANVTLNCNDFRISYNGEFGVGIFSNQANTTIENCNIDTVEASSIYLDGVDGNTIINTSTYSAWNDNGRGDTGATIYLHSSANNIIINSTAYVHLINGEGTGTVNSIWLDNSSFNTLSNLTVSADNAASWVGGIEFLNSSSCNVSNSNIVSDGSVGILLNNAADIIITNNILATGGYAFNLIDSTGNVIIANNLTSNSWVNDNTAGNSYNNSTTGNIYYLASGIPSWQLFDIYNPLGAGYATSGTPLPFSAVKTSNYWSNYGEDWHPWTENTVDICLNVTQTIAVLPANFICSNTIYNLSGNLTSSGSAIIIRAENVTVDCNGFSITGDGTGNGIYSNQNDTIIKNCQISNFSEGVQFEGVNNGSITNTTFIGETSHAVYLYLGANNNKISNIKINSCSNGVAFNCASNNNILSNSSIHTTDVGIYSGGDCQCPGFCPGGSDNNQVINNTIITTTNSAIYTYTSNNNTFLGNNITSDLWVGDDTGGNFYNDSTSGNIYYTANGTPSWEIFDIYNPTGAGYATNGVSLPFSLATVGSYFSGSVYDGHPWTGSTIGLCANATQVISSLPANLICPNTIYSLSENLSVNGFANEYAFDITVQANNVTVDCEGFSVIANATSYPIHSEYNGTTIRNCVLEEGWGGGAFHLIGTTDTLIDNVNTTGISYQGGVAASGTFNLVINNSNIYAPCSAIQGDTMTNTTIENSNFSSDAGSCPVFSLATIDGLDIRSSRINGSASDGIVINNNLVLGASNINISNSTVSAYTVGIYFYAVNNSEITNVNVSSDTGYAVELAASNNNSISNVTATSESGYAIDLLYSASNQIHNSNFTSTNNAGIYMEAASNNTVSNTIANSVMNIGIMVYAYGNNNYFYNVSASGWDAIYIVSASNNIVINSTIFSNSEFGISLSTATNNTFLGNNITAPVWVSDTDVPYCFDSGRCLAEGNDNESCLAISNCAWDGTCYSPETCNGGNQPTCEAIGAYCSWASPVDSFNDSTSGNIYYFANGTPSWWGYNISTGSIPNWATSGTARPFGTTNTPTEWSGYGEDWHPWVGENAPSPNSSLSFSITPPSTQDVYRLGIPPSSCVQPLNQTDLSGIYTVTNTGPVPFDVYAMINQTLPCFNLTLSNTSGCGTGFNATAVGQLIYSGLQPGNSTMLWGYAYSSSCLTMPPHFKVRVEAR